MAQSIKCQKSRHCIMAGILTFYVRFMKERRPGALFLFLPGVGPGLVGEAQEIVHTGVEKFRQLSQRLNRNIGLAQFVVGIGGLMHIQKFCHIFLGEIPILPQGPEMFKHIYHPRPLWVKGYTLRLF